MMLNDIAQGILDGNIFTRFEVDMRDRTMTASVPITLTRNMKMYLHEDQNVQMKIYESHSGQKVLYNQMVEVNSAEELFSLCIGLRKIWAR